VRTAGAATLRLTKGSDAMKIYLAARYSRRDLMKELAAELRRMGHEVTSRWLETDWVSRPDASSAAPPEYREKYAQIDMEDVQAADAVISFTEAPGDGSRGGRHIEFGLAVAWGKRLIVVGYRENLFHHLPAVEFFSSQWDMLRDVFGA
jgi:nucleoside 2-deoxyribosyltransferase